MNKYSLQEHLQEELTPFTSTFKATSYDEEKDEYLCSDARTPHVYDFDAYVKEHCHHPTPASPDAIHVGSKDLADSRPKCNTPRFNERGWSVGVS